MGRWGARQPAAVSYLQTHPQRAARVAAIERLGGAGEAALPDASWIDLKRICTSVAPL